MAGAAAAADRRESGRPGADLALGAQFALGCLAAPAGPTRDVLFQLAFAAYVGACFNLNPFLGRDGYQILVDVLRERNLRRRAREQFARRLARQPDAGDSRLLVRYSVLALAWSVVAVGFAVASESAREELADEQAALRSMATLVAHSVPPGEILLRSAVRPERCWMSTARASCAAWGEEVEGPAVIVQPDRRAARNCGDVRPVRGCSIA